jgi:hypothetical protein
MDEQQQNTIILDGTFGSGAMAEVTIYTNHPNGIKEETYIFPYAMIDRKNLDAFNAAHLIAGYRIMKKAKPSPLSELGL